MNTTTSLAVNWLEDTSGVVGLHGDFIRDIAQQLGQRDQAITTTKLEDQQVANGRISYSPSHMTLHLFTFIL